MNVSWKQYEGQVINNTFLLRRYLGGSRDSAVFLTQVSGTEPVKAAIKLIPEGPSSDLQLSLWRRAAQLSHPSLLRVFQSGRCRLADLDLLYVAMEFAGEDLSQILPERALTPAEARDMLGPLLAALTYLHTHGLVHAHIKPSNVLATGDQLKLSSDTLFPVGESRKAPGQRDSYTAPEAGSVPFTPAADVWSLGVTLLETLTQHAPEREQAKQGDPVVPETLPQPFLDIARHTLRSDPKLRWTIAEIGACLNPLALSAAAAQSVSPLTVPLSSVPAVPAAKLQSPRQAAPAAKAPASSRQAAGAPKQAIVLPNYVLPIAAGVVVLVGILTLPKILGHRAETSSAGKSASAVAPAQEKVQTAAAANAENSRAPKPASRQPVSAAPASAAPASLRTQTPPPAETPKSPASSAGRGEVLDQVLPEVSEKALATIQGTVRVAVLLHVDAAGNVSQAEFDSPGPSQYFANLALTTARRWEFTSPEVDGHSVPSEWRVRFEFKPSGVKAFPQQSTP
jgi:eukaryotic-like serine/threonine-protein kinase